MAILHHYPFCPNSRFVRIVLAEIGLEPELKEERPWERRIEYLGINPAGSTPTLVDGEVVAPGAGVIAEYLDETRGGGLNGRRLLPKDPAARVEVRRLLDWLRQVPGGGHRPSRHREDLQALHGAAERAAGHERDPGGAHQSALPSAIYRLSDRRPELARGRRSDLCGSRRGGSSLLRGLSRRRAMGRGRDGEGLVRPGEIPAGVPRRARRPGARHDPGEPLRRPRFLSGAALKEALAARAASLGFAVMRVARPDAMPDAPDRLRTWLDEGHHGSMDWMAAAPERRADPRALWREVRSIVVLGMNYAPAFDPLASLGLRDRATISVYARARDYHDVIKGKLKEFAGFLAAQGGDAKVFVDTAPVMEKPLAAAAGLGWQGKHTVLVSRAFGNWLFVGSIFTTAELPADDPEPDRCGSCRRCAKASATASSAATTASRSAPGTSSPRPAARRGSCSARSSRRRRWPSSPGSTTPPSGRNSPARR